MLLAASTLILLALAGYAALCTVQPFAPCRACSGTGTRKVTRRGIKLCRRCRGTRYRLRTGRRLTHAGRRLHADGTRHHHTRT
jgi:Zn finger protein HypA/HybF involved in hydrogenase expression